MLLVRSRVEGPQHGRGRRNAKLGRVRGTRVVWTLLQTGVLCPVASVEALGTLESVPCSSCGGKRGL